MDNTKRVIVFETAPYWQPELQRRLLGENVEVNACRTIRDLEARTRGEPFDAVVLDLAADVEGAFRWLGRLEERFGPLPVIAVAAPEQTPLQWHVRELGATAFVDEFVGGKRMAAVCRKLWATECG